MGAKTKTTARKKVVRRKVTRRVTKRVGRPSRFQNQLRELLMKHYPNISLRAYEKLTTAIERALG